MHPTLLVACPRAGERPSTPDRTHSTGRRGDRPAKSRIIVSILSPPWAAGRGSGNCYSPLLRAATDRDVTWLSYHGPAASGRSGVRPLYPQTSSLSERTSCRWNQDCRSPLVASDTAGGHSCERVEAGRWPERSTVRCSPTGCSATLSARRSSGQSAGTLGHRPVYGRGHLPAWRDAVARMSVNDQDETGRSTSLPTCADTGHSTGLLPVSIWPDPPHASVPTGQCASGMSKPRLISA